MVEKAKSIFEKNINLVYSILVLLGVCLSYYDNYKSLEYKVAEYDEKFKKQENEIILVKNQIQDYNVLQYKVNQIDENIKCINDKLDKVLDLEHKEKKKW